jgi:hypothetical protein
MKKRFWLSYDLGIDGDYDGLYGWLDRIKAIECGDGLASFALDVGKSRDIPAFILKQIKQRTSLRKRDRLYLIWRREDKKMSGDFIHGERHRSPWAGYAVEGSDSTEDTEDAD